MWIFSNNLGIRLAIVADLETIDIRNKTIFIESRCFFDLSMIQFYYSKFWDYALDNEIMSKMLRV